VTPCHRRATQPYRPSRTTPAPTRTWSRCVDPCSVTAQESGPPAGPTRIGRDEPGAHQMPRTSTYGRRKRLTGHPPRFGRDLAAALSSVQPPGVTQSRFQQLTITTAIHTDSLSRIIVCLGNTLRMKCQPLGLAGVCAWAGYSGRSCLILGSAFSYLWEPQPPIQSRTVPWPKGHGARGRRVQTCDSTSAGQGWAGLSRSQSLARPRPVARRRPWPLRHSPPAHRRRLRAGCPPAV
jgi:hypothetical protein